MKSNLCRASARAASLAPALLLLLMVIPGALPAVRAQWQTQNFTLKPGWNAIFLEVDASYLQLDDLVANPANPAPNIAEVWLWQPAPSTLQFTTTPAEPSGANSQWAVWYKPTGVADTLNRMVGNAAYLVRNTGTTDFIWRITGKPVPPRYQWTTTGLNFIGFPTPAAAPPRFDNFLDPVPELLNSAQIYRYPGGEVGPPNPQAVLGPSALFNTRVNRGEAFWIRSSDPGYYNRYFGPLDVHLQNAAGVEFSTALGTSSLRLKNTTATAQTVLLSLVASGPPPPVPNGQSAIVGTPPLLVRGPRNPTDLTYTYSVLNPASPQTFSLAPSGTPGGDLEIILGLNRSAMSATPGDFYAGVLRFTDAGGRSQVDVPVSATVADTVGLWVGSASVDRVGQYLKTYTPGPDGHPALVSNPASGAPYEIDHINTALTPVSRPFPLRLIVHNDAGGAARLLQRVFFGLDGAGNSLIATSEDSLASATLRSARRISAPHLPFAPVNLPWLGVGTLRPGLPLGFTVDLDYRDQASNPFLHTYHPDHDNLDPDFQQVAAQGAESYTVSRQITLAPAAPGSDFASLTAGSSSLGGTYTETVTFRGRNASARAFNLQGSFLLNRISSIPTLTSP